MSKKPYLAANIRAGFTVKDCAEWAQGKTGAPTVQVRSFNHGRDVCGNGTAHYICHVLLGDEHLITVVESGKRREQVGYSGQNEAALYALSKLGFEVDTRKAGSYDYQGDAVYPLLNFPPKAV